MMPSVLYPLAVAEGRLTWIEDAQRGGRYDCIGCNERVVARQGARKSWHFAHFRAPRDCEPDGALHRAAQEVVQAALTSAAQQGEPYEVRLPCATCRELLAFNLAVSGLSVEAEHSLVSHTRSDLVVYRPNQNPVVVEIVVTHDLEPETAARYNDAGTTVFVVKPAWETLRDLERGITPDRSMGGRPVHCAECRRAERRRAELEEWAAGKLSRLDARVAFDGRDLPFRPWRHDSYGRRLYIGVRSRTHAAALILTELGFRQAREKPWLFWYRITPDCVVFANFGSTEVIPIWEDPAAHVHWRFTGDDHDAEAALIAGVFTRLRAAHVPARANFYHGGYDPAPDAPDPDARQHVDQELLSRLLAAPEV